MNKFYHIQSTKKMKGNTHLLVVIVTFADEVAAGLVYSNACSSSVRVDAHHHRIKQMPNARLSCQLLQLQSAAHPQ